MPVELFEQECQQSGDECDAFAADPRERGSSLVRQHPIVIGLASAAIITPLIFLVYLAGALGLLSVVLGLIAWQAPLYCLFRVFPPLRHWKGPLRSTRTACSSMPHSSRMR